MMGGKSRLRPQVVSGLTDTDRLIGCVVVLDVIRASNTIIACLEAGAVAVHPVGELERALALKAAYPGWLLWGERGGVRVKGFEGDNSPAQAARRDLTGLEIILTTSNGTRALAGLVRADTVLIGSLANAHALCRVVEEIGPSSLTLLAVGSSGGRAAEEDLLTAHYLRALLEGRPALPQDVNRRLLACPAADDLRRLGQDDDLAVCAEVDRASVVPWVETGRGPRVVPWTGRSIP